MTEGLSWVHQKITSEWLTDHSGQMWLQFLLFVTPGPLAISSACEKIAAEHSNTLSRVKPSCSLLSMHTCQLIDTLQKCRTQHHARCLGEQQFSKKGLPLPLGRRVCETKSKNGRSKTQKTFISRVFCAQRGIETMVSERGQTMG